MFAVLEARTWHRVLKSICSRGNRCVPGWRGGGNGEGRSHRLGGLGFLQRCQNSRKRREKETNTRGTQVARDETQDTSLSLVILAGTFSDHQCPQTSVIVTGNGKRASERYRATYEILSALKT
ncbi:hypothetical protein Bbelb_063130 [Branchiostoma belcheri]|nr:hypothetical protein Bbelb_063130 [Branchiostoma belcheri]